MGMRLRKIYWGVLILGVVLGVSACDGGVQRPKKTGTEKTVRGVSPAEIRIGSSLALSGHAGDLGRNYLHGALSYLKKINAAGGIQGRRINLISYDDAYDPAKCMVNTQKLLTEESVFALFNYVGTPTTSKIVPIVEQYDIPLVGMFTGARVLREPYRAMIFNVRASYAEEIDLALRQMAHDLTLRKIAIFYQNDNFGYDGIESTEISAEKYGMTIVAKGAYQRGSMAVEEALESIVDSGAEAVVMIGTYSPCAKFIQLSQQRGFYPLFYSVSFVGSENLANELDRLGYTQDPRQRIVVSQVVPPPDNIHLSAPREYRELLQKYFPQENPTFGGLEGYINARVLVEGLRRAGKHPTRKSFAAGLESMKNYELGIGQPLVYSESNHHGLHHVYFVALEEGRWPLFTNWATKFTKRIP